MIMIKNNQRKATLDGQSVGWLLLFGFMTKENYEKEK